MGIPRLGNAGPQRWRAHTPHEKSTEQPILNVGSLGATGSYSTPPVNIFEPGTDTDHAVSLRVQNPCTSPGEDITLTNAGIDVVEMS